MFPTTQSYFCVVFPLLRTQGGYAILLLTTLFRLSLRCILQLSSSSWTIAQGTVEVEKMLRDAQGLDVTTDSPLTIAAINRYTDQALAYGKDAIAIFKGIEADPECAIANAHAAAFLPLP